MSTETPTLNEQHASKLNDTAKEQAHGSRAVREALADWADWFSNILGNVFHVAVACFSATWLGWCAVCGDFHRGLTGTIPLGELKSHSQARWHDVPHWGVVLGVTMLLLKQLYMQVPNEFMAYMTVTAVVFLGLSSITLGVRGYRMRKKADNDGNAGEDCG